MVSPQGRRSDINARGEDLTFVLSVSVSNINPAYGTLTLEDLSFTNVRLRGAGNRRDAGAFVGFSPPGPGAPTSPSTYSWRNARNGPDFPGHTPHRRFPSFDLAQMNGAPITVFTHRYLRGRYSFRSVGVSVIVNPEPSGWMLGLMAFGLLIVPALRKRQSRSKSRARAEMNCA